MPINKLRVLVVDDTIVYRKVVSDILSEIPGVEVVGVAHNGKIALDKIKILKPDLVTLDIEMPVMNGIEVLEALKRDQSTTTGAVMLSTLTAEGSIMTMKALELGAFDFILKPQSTNLTEGKNLLKNALLPVIAAFKMRGGGFLRSPHRPENQAPPAARRISPTLGANVTSPKIVARRGRSEIVTIGISTGGPNALTAMLPQLPKDLGVPVLIVQHMPPVFTASLAASLNKKCALEVKEAVHREPLMPNVVYIAPGGKQMKLAAATDGIQRLISITDDPPENSCKPAADYLFRSVGDYFVGRTTAVIMTGMGADGTKGLQILKSKGAYIIGQDEYSCVVYGMPKSAAEAGLVDIVCPLNKIAEEIVRSVKGR